MLKCTLPFVVSLGLVFGFLRFDSRIKAPFCDVFAFSTDSCISGVSNIFRLSIESSSFNLDMVLLVTVGKELQR